MKWAAWIAALPVLYVLSIGPVAYFKERAELGPAYVKGSVKTSRCTSYIFFRGTALPSIFSRLPEWMQKFYMPLSNLVTDDKAPGRWVNDYTTWWVSLAY